MVKPERLELQSADGVQLNLDALYQIAPSCFTEAEDPKTGKVKRVVNFVTLRQLLGDNTVEDVPEAYEFNWVGKQSARAEVLKPIEKTLRPVKEDSVEWDNTQNLYIEGDNLEVLKLLQKSYLGKVKMIYIDPPYNTGNDFVYHDDFARTQEEEDLAAGNIDELGNRYIKNTDSNGKYHSDWCSMIYSRLMVARSLLKQDGAIFISIDDNEVDNLRKICDEVFGEINFVSQVSWQKVYSPKNNNKGISSEVEYLLCYSKEPNWAAGKLERTKEMDAIYKNPDNDPNGSWTSSDASAPGAATHQGMVYGIQSPFTGEFIYPTRGRCWQTFQDDLFVIMNGWAKYRLEDIHNEKERAAVCGVSLDSVRKGVKSFVLDEPLEVAKQKAENILKNGVWPLFYFTGNGQGGIRKKTYLKDMDGRTVTNLWPFEEVGHNDEAKKEVAALFDGHAPFDTPKPVRLMKRMLKVATNEDSLILDFFSGSATMAHAIIDSNREDGGHRKFIMVQIPEEVENPNYRTLCDIGKDRIRRAGKKIKEESPLTTQDLDTGFRVFRVDSSNFEEVEHTPKDWNQDQLDLFLNNIKSDRNDLDLLFGCMLDWGVKLSLPMTSEEVDGKMIYTVNDGDLVACFADDVTENVVKAMADKMPLRVIFRDSCFSEDSAKINIYETFKQLMDWSDQEVVKNIRVI